MARSYARSGQGQEDNQRHDSPGTRGLGSTGGQGQSNGDDIKNRIDQGDRERIHRNPESSLNAGKANLGKILSQLRELQRSHLAYVEAHEQRLQSRLKAAQEHHNQALNQMKLLEQEILSLLGEGETA